MRYFFFILMVIINFNSSAQAVDSLELLNVNIKLLNSSSGKISREDLIESKGLVVESKFYYDYQITGYELNDYVFELVMYTNDSNGELPKPFLDKIKLFQKNKTTFNQKHLIIFNNIKCVDKFGKNFKLKSLEIEVL